MRLLEVSTVVLLVWVALVFQSSNLYGASALEPATTGGIEAVDRALRGLTVHRRLLVVGAHPDDEDTTLLTLVRNGMGGESAYFALSRGEGGQNLIGPELGVGLGLIRTGELLSARQVEGAHQFFSRAYDFGYTRSLEEAFRRWPRDQLLEDAVRVIRRFKPQIVVAIFPEDSRAGHGQHQASGVIAREASAQAGMPDLFPDLTVEGLPPWQPEAFYRSFWWDPEETTIKFSLGGVDPISGKSMYQIAAASRSMHRSQDMGTMQKLGRIQGGLGWEEGRVGEGQTELFGGIDTRLSAIASYLPSGDLRNRTFDVLEEIDQLAQETRSQVAVADLERAVPNLGLVVRQLSSLLDTLATQGDGIEGQNVLKDLVGEKLELATEGLAAAAGVALDATADINAVVPGGELQVTATMWNSGSQIVELVDVDILASQEWSVVSTGEPERNSRIEGLEGLLFTLKVDAEATPSLPYFLIRPLEGDMYDWGEIAEETRGEPLANPPLRARFKFNIGETPVSIEREVVHQGVDQASGETRVPIRIIPRLEIKIEPDLILWPVQKGGKRRVEIAIQSNSNDPVAGRVRVAVEPSWPQIDTLSFSIQEPQGRSVLGMDLTLPANADPASYQLKALAELDDGAIFDTSYPVINYPHIRPLPMRREAVSQIQILDVILPNVNRIGYVRGASDRVPETLTAIGLNVEILGPEELESANFSKFDAIVVGSRAYETDTALKAANGALLDYVSAGGLLLVQYQQYQFVKGGYAPFPLEIGRPHGRVTNEESPVMVLEPSHPVFSAPNKTAASDWVGWVQERGLYFASEWDPEYTPLLALQDKDQEEERGSLLVARVGEGTYVYTGLSFFRELPAGVPGALRLFANLLALGEP